MSNHNLTIMENIFREMIEVIGHEKAVEILNSTKLKAEEKPKKVEKKTEKKEEPAKEEKKKRIPRMSPTLATQLKSELSKVGLKYSDDDKKEFEKVKKEFVTYVDDLTEDDFTDKGLTDHMHDFADTKNPKISVKAEEKPKKAEVKAEEKPKKAEEKAEEKPKKAEVKAEEKPKKVSKKSSAKEELKVDTELSPPTNAVDIHEVTLEDLRLVEMIATPSGPFMGVYWDGDVGRWIRGPDEDDDEDLVESVFGGKDYMVGEKTGRVYENTNDRDVFHGFIGVGKFSNMKMS